MLSHSRILIVDPSVDSREVLRTLLERHGAQTWETARIRQARRLAERTRPDVIVLDNGGPQQVAGEAIRDLGQFASRNDTPIVVLGTLGGATSPFSTGHFVPKPYHYGTLIRRIEELLGNCA